VAQLHPRLTTRYAPAPAPAQPQLQRLNQTVYGGVARMAECDARRLRAQRAQCYSVSQEQRWKRP